MFSTTVLVVNKSYLKAHPAAIKGLIHGELDAITHINANKTSARDRAQQRADRP